MNGVDYTKQLAKEREYYQDSNRKLREASEKRIDDTNKRADHVMTKQRENFIEDRAELENSYQKNLDHLKEKTASSMSNTSSKFNEEMEKERQNFTQESLKKSKDFDQRLNDIKSSYQKAFDSESNRNDTVEKNLKNKYASNVDNIRNDSEEKLKEYQDRMTGTGADLKDQYNRERQQLVRAQEDRLTEAYKDAATKRAELKDRIQYDAKKQKEVQEGELAQQRQYNQDRINTIQKQFAERSDTMSRDYSARNDRLVKEQQSTALKTNREHQDKMDEVRRGYNDSLRMIELDKRRRDNGSGEFSDVANRQQGLKDQVINDNKIKHLKDELVESQRTYQARADREHVAHKELLHEQSAEATARQDKKLNEANADKLVTVAREREKAERQIQNREHQNKLDKTAYESQLMNERNNANDRIARLKENFNTSMKTLEDKNKTAMDEVTKTSNKDKAEFMKLAQERRSDEIFEMKRAFGRMMDATVQDYEQRLATYQRDNEYLKMSMGDKLAMLTQQTEKQLQSQKALFDDRREADVKSQQLLMDQRENQLKKNFSDMNIAYQKKIDKMQLENDSKFKLMVNDYETKLKELKATTSRELAMKDTAQQIELDRVKKAYEDEKTRVVNAYESQIESLKNGNEEKIRQMAEFKRLS